MVEQNYIMYVNDRKVLRASPINFSKTATKLNLKFSIPEKHLICGLILQGTPVKGDRLKNFPFSPVEKYLFEFSNIHFMLLDLEFRQENTSYNLSVDPIADLLLVDPPRLVEERVYIYSTRLEGAVFKISIHVPYTAQVSFSNASESSDIDLGTVQPMPNSYGENGFDYAAYDVAHTFVVTGSAAGPAFMAGCFFWVKKVGGNWKKFVLHPIEGYALEGSF